MKRICLAITLAAAALPGLAATQVGVSIGVSQPGFYGRIDLGGISAPPAVIYAQPVVIAPSPVAVYQSPIYMRVPPGYARDWRRHCAAYGACNRPVYFVQENWYHDHYRRYDDDHYHDHDHDHDRDRGHGHAKHDKHGKHDKH